MNDKNKAKYEKMATEESEQILDENQKGNIAHLRILAKKF